MKHRYFLFLLFFVCSGVSFSQDTLYFLNGRKVAAYVLDANPEFIRYRLPEEADYKIRKISPHKIYMIKYRTNREEIIRTQKNKYSETYFSRGKNNFYALSTGIGLSHGFGGLMFEKRWGDIEGWGYNAGIGVAPFGTAEHKATVNFSIGGKFYFYKGLNIGLQFGTIPSRKVLMAFDVTDKRYHSYDTIRIAFGPSLLLGWDCLFNRYFGMTSAFGFSINTTRPDFHPVMVAFDFGLMIRLPERAKHGSRYMVRGSGYTEHGTRHTAARHRPQ